MNYSDRITELEAVLKDIVTGCDQLMQVPLNGSFKAYVLEVRRVASAPLNAVVE